MALALGVAGQAVAQVYTLTDLNSIARIDPYSQRGMFDWSVEGQNQLYQQWFWYRVGNTGPEASINNISAPVVTTIDSRSISLAYSAQTYSVEINYLLTGGAVGSRVSAILETIRIRNLGTSPLDMHFFQYSDFNLQGCPRDLAALSSSSDAGPRHGPPWSGGRPGILWPAMGNTTQPDGRIRRTVDVRGTRSSPHDRAPGW